MTEAVTTKQTYRELFRQMDDEYYEAICEWCRLQSQDIEQSYAKSLCQALVQVISCEATEHIEEFWHKVAMNYFIPSDDVEYFSSMNLWQKFPYGQTYMPCIEELYHKYELDYYELLRKININLEVETGHNAVCPCCDTKDGLNILKNYDAFCTGKNCRMHRREHGTHWGLPIVSNRCHTSYLLHRIHVKEKG